MFPGRPGCLGCPAGYSCRIGYSTGSTGSGSGSTAATAERTGERKIQCIKIHSHAFNIRGKKCPCTVTKLNPLQLS